MNLSNAPGGRKSAVWLDEDPHVEPPLGDYDDEPIDHYADTAVVDAYSEPYRPEPDPRRPRQAPAPRPPRPRAGPPRRPRPGPEPARAPFLAEPLLTAFTEPKTAAVAGGLGGLLLGMVVTSLLFLTLFGGDDNPAGNLTVADGTDAQALQPGLTDDAGADLGAQAAQGPLPAPAAPTPGATAQGVPAADGIVTQDPNAAPAPAAPAPAGDDGPIQAEVLALTNAERAKVGCPALTLDPLLNAAADGHSEDMALNDYFAHEDLAGNGPDVRLNAVGYAGQGWAENIAAGYPDPLAVVTGWMNSEGHRANILNCGYIHLGVGYAQGAGPVYWTQVFGAG